jgi:hypothetical protein
VDFDRHASFSTKPKQKLSSLMFNKVILDVSSLENSSALLKEVDSRVVAAKHHQHVPLLLRRHFLCLHCTFLIQPKHTFFSSYPSKNIFKLK